MYRAAKGWDRDMGLSGNCSGERGWAVESVAVRGSVKGAGSEGLGQSPPEGRAEVQY